MQKFKELLTYPTGLNHRFSFMKSSPQDLYKIVTARSSGTLKAKQKLGVTFNSDKLGGIAFTKISKLTLSELKDLPSFCFTFKIPDDRAVTNKYR